MKKKQTNNCAEKTKKRKSNNLHVVIVFLFCAAFSVWPMRSDACGHSRAKSKTRSRTNIWRRQRAGDVARQEENKTKQTKEEKAKAL